MTFRFWKKLVRRGGTRVSSGGSRAPDVIEAQPLSRPFRELRVFISSTFLDMTGEREELVKRIFPQLRDICERRAVSWCEVDLRWGITDQSRAEGKVLQYCLAEIDRCRPYFIGILGERYGWIPKNISEDLIELHPWLAEYPQHSVTALEMLYGVIRNVPPTERAFFYFRNPAYLYSMTKEQRSQFMPGDNDERAKLSALKERVRRTGVPVRENYADPKELGQLVLADLKRVIDKVFPESSVPNALDAEAEMHEAFAASRTAVYLARSAQMNQLDEYATGDGPPLVIIGESGIGKSALFANWALRYRTKHPKDLLIMHFVGSSPSSSDWMTLLRRILSEFKRHFSLDYELPTQPESLAFAFADWSYRVVSLGSRIVIVVDALNQLDDQQGALDLEWLPPQLPAGMRLLLSTVPGRCSYAANRRNWPTLIVEPLEVGERRLLIQEFLGRYGKQVSTQVASQLAQAPQSANPLFLCAVLEELRTFGKHEHLIPTVSEYLQACDATELYRRILLRWQKDYSRQANFDVVAGSLSLISAAREGLSEAELLELLGNDNGPLPRAEWVPFFFAARQSLINRGGLLNFSHQYIREAVRREWLPTKVLKNSLHTRIADYFDQGELNERKLVELPWQLAQASEWARLAKEISRKDFVAAAIFRNEFELRAHWALLETRSNERMLDWIGPEMPDVRLDAGYAWNMAHLLAETGHPEESLRIRRDLVKYYRDQQDDEQLAAASSNLARVLLDRGELQEAMALFEDAGRLFASKNQTNALAGALTNQGTILQLCGRVDEAAAMFRKAAQMHDRSGDRKGVAQAIGNLAGLLYLSGNLDEALAAAEEQCHISTLIGNQDGIISALSTKANILLAHGQLGEAMATYEQEEQKCREFGNQLDLERCLGNQAVLLSNAGEFGRALELLAQQEKICRNLGSQDGLARSLGNRANLLQMKRDFRGAMALHHQEEAIFRKLNKPDGLMRSLGNQAIIKKSLGDMDGAWTLLKEQELICRSTHSIEGLAASLGNQAVILMERGQLKEAASAAEEGYRLAASHELRPIAGQLSRIMTLVQRKKLLENTKRKYS